jgi:hypothetical protein
MRMLIIILMHTIIQSHPTQAPLRKVVRRVPVPDQARLAHDHLACGHSVVVLRHSRQLPYWHCYACVLPQVGADALDALSPANDTTPALQRQQS